MRKIILTQKGSGLVQMMVSVGIMGIVAVGMMQIFEFQVKQTAFIQAKNEENDLHRQIQFYMISEEICKKTFETIEIKDLVSEKLKQNIPQIKAPSGAKLLPLSARQGRKSWIKISPSNQTQMFLVDGAVLVKDQLGFEDSNTNAKFDNGECKDQGNFHLNLSVQIERLKGEGIQGVPKIIPLTVITNNQCEIISCSASGSSAPPPSSGGCEGGETGPWCLEKFGHSSYYLGPRTRIGYGNNNLFIGEEAGHSNSTGYSNIFTGS